LKEVLTAHRVQLNLASGRLGGWRDFESSFELMGIGRQPAAVLKVLRLRNVLAHARGELRTEADRRAFAGPQDDFPSSWRIST
jgi:hypothetical protein